MNGENVQRWELETALKQAEANAGGPVPADSRDAIVRSILDEVVMDHLLAQEARSRNMDVSEAEVDTAMAAIRKDFPTEDAFKQALLLQGLTPEQLREVTRRGMQARKVVDAEITSKVAVQDAEVDAFYKNNIDRFKQGETVRVSHIYFAVPADAPATQKNQARAAAQETLRQLKAGADFAKLAREQSDDPSAENGGEMPFFGRGDLPPDFENVAFGLKARHDERRGGARDRPAHRQAPRDTRAENGATRRSAREPEAISAAGAASEAAGAVGGRDQGKNQDSDPRLTRTPTQPSITRSGSGCVTSRSLSRLRIGAHAVRRRRANAILEVFCSGICLPAHAGSPSRSSRSVPSLWLPLLPRADFTPLPPLLFLVLLSSLTSAFKVQLPIASGSNMSVSYIVDIAALILRGPHATMIVGAASGWSQSTLNARSRPAAHRTLFNMAVLVLTVQAAGQVYQRLGGTAERRPARSWRSRWPAWR